MPAEKIRLRIGDLAKAVLVTGQAYQDPKDALNEFVSNAADEYAEAGPAWRGGRIRVVLRRRGRRPVIAVADDGRGMDLERLRQVARNLFDSAKAGDPRTIGEKAIGILAFQQLGGRCDILSRPLGESRTHALRLVRGEAVATLEPDDRRHARDLPGTTAYITDLDPEVLRVLTLRKVVDYFRRRRGPALARGDYAIEVIEGRASETVTPERPEGVRLELSALGTLWGRLEFNLYVAPRSDRLRRVSVVGRGGVTIIDDLCDLEEFDRAPWDTDRVSGEIGFDALVQTAGRRAIIRDGNAFPIFVDAIRRIEPVVQRAIERVARDVDEAVAERVSDLIRRVFGRVLRELADLENPMRAPVGDEPGEGALFAVEADHLRLPGTGEPPGSGLPAGNGSAAWEPLQPPEPPDLDELEPRLASEDPPLPTARPDRRRSTALPSLAPDPRPGTARSRLDSEAGVVLYNESHPDYLMVKDDESTLVDYLSLLVTKEYAVYNNPKVSGDEVAEEMVRLLVRLRRHLPSRR
jgi:hypothetical protein